MKAKLIAVGLVLAARAFATSELPEGSQIWQVAGYATTLHFFDEGRVIPYDAGNGQQIDVHGWVSLYGELNGGVLFNTDLFALDPTPAANLWWDFGDSGFSLLYVVVNDGQDNCKIFRTGSQTLAGNLDVSAFSNATIQTLGIYGRLSGEDLPDAGATSLMLALAFLSLLLGRAKWCA